MSDIRKEFEAWYNNRFANRNPELCEHGVEDMEEAYQAGRAYDIKGLVAEIESNILYASSGNPIKQGRQLSYNEGIRTALEIIRKHFGEE